MINTKNLDLVAGIPVADYAAALKWCERLLGSPPTFLPNDIEAVWSLPNIATCTLSSARNTLVMANTLSSSMILMPSSHRSQIGDSTLRNEKPTRTAFAKQPTAILMETRSGSAALRCNPGWHEVAVYAARSRTGVFSWARVSCHVSSRATQRPHNRFYTLTV